MPINSYKEDEKAAEASKLQTLCRLFSYLLQYKLPIFGVLLIMAYCVAVSLINPLLIEKAIDDYIAVKDFMGLYKLAATEEEIISAAKAVHAHEFITRLPNGYDTRLEERGGGLSVGQKQLLAFARTMVSMPKILILDEATSSIDTQTELLVQEGIEALLKGRTSFVIAHRLSTIQKADRIFVIDQGGIIEEGNHDTLMAKGGAYYKLQMAQLKDVI